MPTSPPNSESHACQLSPHRAGAPSRLPAGPSAHACQDSCVPSSLPLSAERKKQPSKRWPAGPRVRRGSLQKHISKCLVWEERGSRGCPKKGDFSESAGGDCPSPLGLLHLLFVSSLGPDHFICCEASGPNMGLILINLRHLP